MQATYTKYFASRFVSATAVTAAVTAAVFRLNKPVVQRATKRVVADDVFRHFTNMVDYFLCMTRPPYNCRPKYMCDGEARMFENVLQLGLPNDMSTTLGALSKFVYLNVHRLLLLLLGR